MPRDDYNFGDFHYTNNKTEDCEADEAHPHMRFLSAYSIPSEPSFLDYADIS